jgi:hypothetical protein
METTQKKKKPSKTEHKIEKETDSRDQMEKMNKQALYIPFFQSLFM